MKKGNSLEDYENNIEGFFKKINFKINLNIRKGRGKGKGKGKRKRKEKGKRN